MGEQAGMPGELLYEYTCSFTQVVEYGVSAEALFAGQTPPPSEGARFDVYFEGPVTGAKLKGTVRAWITCISAPMVAPSSTFTQRSQPRTERSSRWRPTA